ncbi:MAG: luxQ 3 [Phycisphaerales bacterium]|nr:luxQ 3 [Phycisphaerales bacterium]
MSSLRPELATNTTPPPLPAEAWLAGYADGRTSPGRTVRRCAAAAVTVAVVCFLLAHVSGKAFISQTGQVAGVWLPMGVPLGLMLLTRRRHWAWALLATGVGNTAANVLSGRPLSASVFFYLVNAAETLYAAWVMRAWFGGRVVRFATVSEVMVFATVACLPGCAAAGLTGAVLMRDLLDTPFLELWAAWTAVDALGLLVVTPVVVTFGTWRPTLPRGRRLAEVAAYVAGFAVVVASVFPRDEGRWPLLAALPLVSALPFLLWAGLRFGPRGAAALSLATILISARIALQREAAGTGSAYSLRESMFALQVSGILWTVSALVLAAVTAERTTAAAALAASERKAREAERGARTAERAAMDNHRQLQALFDHTTALIFTKSVDGRYTQANKAFERHIHVRAEDVVGRRDHDLYAKVFADRARAKDLEVIESGEPQEYESVLPLPDGDRTMHAMKFPLTGADGAVTGVCVVATDITSRKAAEENLRRAKEEAEALAARAEALARQAEAANRAKTEFLANVSHEIRTPLTSIFGYADLLLSPGLPAAERAAHVRTIRRNGEHLLSILDDVLDMSKIEAGRMTVERVACHVPRLVADVLSLMRQRATAKGLALQVSCPTPVPLTVWSDPTRLRQVLINLVGHDVKFTEAGGVTVELSLDENGPAPALVAEVSDTGIGMTPEQVSTLGRPFSQADPSHARRYGGSGLGVSICYRLAELMGGSVACRSRPGVGTTFTLRLPTGDLHGVPRVVDLCDVQPDPDDDPPAAAPPRLSGRVLVAEDSPDTRRLLMTYLGQAGADAEAVDDGQAAVDRALAAWRAGRPYDLILMDVQMPRMDGEMATRLLRADGYRGRIVALTANAMDADRDRCVAAGCDGFLTKPIQGRAFVEATRGHLAAAAAAAAGNSSRPRRDGGQGSIGNGQAGDARAGTDMASPPRDSGESGPALFSTLGDDPVIRTLLPEYLRELEPKVEAILAAVGQADWPLAARLAHQLKGSAGGYGFATITAAAGRLEQAARGTAPDTECPVAAGELAALCRSATTVTA